MSGVYHIIWWDGEHKGKRLEDVPDYYLRLIVRNPDFRYRDQPLYDAAVELLKQRGNPDAAPAGAAEASKESLEEVRLSVKAIFRDLAIQYHPDKHKEESKAYERAMSALNDFKAQLLESIDKLSNK